MDLSRIETQEVLDRISRHCPESLTLYLQCLNRANKQGTVFFSKATVDVVMSENWGKFCKDIKKLAKENLLEWHPLDGGISVTLAALDENE